MFLALPPCSQRKTACSLRVIVYTEHTDYCVRVIARRVHVTAHPDAIKTRNPLVRAPKERLSLVQTASTVTAGYYTDSPCPNNAGRFDPTRARALAIPSRKPFQRVVSISRAESRRLMTWQFGAAL